jgi:hypothetical protein
MHGGKQYHQAISLIRHALHSVSGLFRLLDGWGVPCEHPIAPELLPSVNVILLSHYANF